MTPDNYCVALSDQYNPKKSNITFQQTQKAKITKEL